MTKRSSSYASPPKRGAAPNRIVLGKRAAAWFYWGLVAVLGVLVVGATYWLLTHPLTA